MVLWNATKLRTLLLCTGPIVLKGKLAEAAYCNFLISHAGVRMLCSGGLTMQQYDYGELLFHTFGEHCGNLYGLEMVVYNVHSLIHMLMQDDLVCYTLSPVSYMKIIYSSSRSS